MSSSATSSLIPSSTSSVYPSTTPQSSSKSVPIPAIVIPLAVVGLAFIIILLWSNQRKLRNAGGNNSRNHSRNASNSSTSRPSFFSNLWSGIRKNFAVQYREGENGNTNASGNGRAAAAATATTTAARRGRRDRLRRTESGSSVKTVPEYKFDAGEDEMVLYKAANSSLQDSSSALDLTRLDSRFSNFGDEPQGASDLNSNSDVNRRMSVRLTQGEAGRSSVALLDENGEANFNSNRERGAGTNEEQVGPRRTGSGISRLGSLGNSIRRSIGMNLNREVDNEAQDGNGDAGDGHQMQQIQEMEATTGQSNSMVSSNGGAGERVSSPPTIGGIMHSWETGVSTPMGDYSSRGPAPEYQDLFPRIEVDDLDPVRMSVETIPDGSSAPSPSVSSSNDTSGGRAHGRDTSNATLLGLRSIFGRNNSLRSSSRSSNPQNGHRRFESTSAISTSANSNAFTPRSSLSLARIASNLTSSNQSTASINSQQTLPRTSISQISRPLPESLIRSQYELPRAGISSQQMSFLGSVENLGKYGVLNERDGGNNQGGTLPPPFQDDREEEERRERERSRNHAPLLTNAEVYNRTLIGGDTVLPLPGTVKATEEEVLGENSSEEAGTSTDQAEESSGLNLSADDQASSSSETQKVTSASASLIEESTSSSTASTQGPSTQS